LRPQSNSFDSFKTSLTNSAGRLGRSIQDKRSQPRMLAMVMGGVVALFIIYHLFR
jgi:blocked-early-in-transport protein 1